MLVRISGALGVPVTAFFAGLEGDPDPASQDVQLRREAIEVARAFARIADPELRRVPFDLFRRLGVAIAADKPPERPRPLSGEPGLADAVSAADRRRDRSAAPPRLA